MFIRMDNTHLISRCYCRPNHYF